ncbi:MAG: EAL domain-containing protein [Alphaproteobacteria bacterium]|nr:EAL domain-containing protein [Alphaproteobacteria bacterium]
MLKKINEVSNAVVIIDGKGIIKQINPAATRLFGYKEKELIEKPISLILPATTIVKEENGGLVFELLDGQIEQLYKQGVKKDGTSFEVDISLVPFQKDKEQYYNCIIKDDSSRFFHERLESLSNVILRRVLIGETLEQFASFIASQLSIMFTCPLIWVGKVDKEEKGVQVLACSGEMSNMVSVNTFYTSNDKLIHPAVRAVERMEICVDEVKDEDGKNYRLMAFPFLSKKESMGVLTILAPTVQLGHLVLNRLENVALRLGMILQIADDQTFLRLLGTAISTAMNSVMITDETGRIIWINEAFTNLTGYTLKDVQGKKPNILSSGLHSRAFYKELWDTILSGKFWRGEIVNRNKAGSLFVCNEMITPILSQDGKITHFVVINDDITAKKNADERILRLSNYDQLTELPNRSLFHKKLEQALERRKNKEGITAVLLLDVTEFSRYNDTMGHDAGDTILKILADRLVSCISSKDEVARIEGDEFGIILNDVSSLEEVNKQAHQIIKKVEEPISLNKTEICLSACVGISLAPNDANTSERLLSYADMALFKAKKSRFDTHFFFSQEMNQEIEERLVLERDMRKAIAEKQFFLDYQPQVDLNTGKVTGFEALVRWRHPQKGLILPTLFISVAEDTGLITPLCEYVMDVAFDQIKKWNKLGLGKITVAVNLSAAQFQDKNLLSTIQKMLKRKKIQPSFLEMEITESLLMKDTEHACSILRQLSDLGIGIAIDDFGTGYSSLSYLHKFSVDKLKIDKSFVRDLESNRENAEIIKAIVSLGHALELNVIAEGCENEKELEILKSLQCDAVQGFYFSRPLSTEKAENFIRQLNSK